MRIVVKILLLIAVSTIACADRPAGAQTIRPLTELRKELDKIADSFGGNLGYSVYHIKRNEKVDCRGDERFPTASTIKIAMLCAAMEQQQQGKIGYYEQLTIEEGDFEGGTGFMRHFREGIKPTFKQLAHLMITASDNVATNVIGRRVGMAAVNDWIGRHGLNSTRLFVPWPDVKTGIEKDPELKKQINRWGMGVTTPNDMTRLLAMINEGRAGTPAATDEIKRILSHQFFDEGIATQVPPDVVVGSKSGIMQFSRSDIALVYSPSGVYALAIYTNDSKDGGIGWDNEHSRAIRAISRAVWRHYHPDSQWTPPEGIERFSHGREW